MLAVFESKLELIQIFPAVKLTEDPRDRKPDGLFDKYDVSPYILNNNGATIANSVGFFGLSIAFLLLSACLNDLNNTILDMILHILKGIIVWNFVISFILSNYQSSVLYAGASLKWYSFESNFGILNFCVGVVYSLFIISIPFLIFLKIREIRNLKFKAEQENINKNKEMATMNSKLAMINQMDKMTRKSYSKHISQQTEQEKEPEIEKKSTFEGVPNQEGSIKGQNEFKTAI